MSLQYLGLKEINGPLVFLDHVGDLFPCKESPVGFAPYYSRQTVHLHDVVSRLDLPNLKLHG